MVIPEQRSAHCLGHRSIERSGQSAAVQACHLPDHYFVAPAAAEGEEERPRFYRLHFHTVYVFMLLVPGLSVDAGYVDLDTITGAVLFAALHSVVHNILHIVSIFAITIIITSWAGSAWQDRGDNMIIIPRY